jgi:hypothetical protein
VEYNRALYDVVWGHFNNTSFSYQGQILVYEFAVRPEFQKRGIGATIIRRLQVVARNSDLIITMFATGASKVLVERLGFRHVESVRIQLAQESLGSCRCDGVEASVNVSDSSNGSASRVSASNSKGYAWYYVWHGPDHTASALSNWHLSVIGKSAPKILHQHMPGKLGIQCVCPLSVKYLHIV